MHICIHPWLLLSLCISFWFRIMHCCIPTPATDNNTSTDMIWVTLIMASAANCRGIVREFHIAWRVAILSIYKFFTYCRVFTLCWEIRKHNIYASAYSAMEVLCFCVVHPGFCLSCLPHCLLSIAWWIHLFCFARKYRTDFDVILRRWSLLRTG